MKQGKTAGELFVGQKVSTTRVFTKDDVRKFAEQSGDNNPIHVDEDYATTTRFGRCIVHGHFVASMFSGILGTELPGIGTIYLSQDLRYTAPVYIDDEVTAEVVVSEINIERNRIKLETNAFNQDGEQVISGIAIVKSPNYKN